MTKNEISEFIESLCPIIPPVIKSQTEKSNLVTRPDLGNSGCRAYIPLFNDMDSLNSLSAASILLHHCQTQWIELGSR